MDIILENMDVISIDNLVDGNTYFMQSAGYNDEVGFSQCEETPSTFFIGRSFKFTKKSGKNVYLKAMHKQFLPAEIHIEEL